MAKVSSCFEDVWTFLRTATKLGFKVTSKNLTNGHSCCLILKRLSLPQVGLKAQLLGLKLQTCLYKCR